MNKFDMIRSLQDGICEVTFTKVNGDSRTMKCTLNSVIVPTAEAVRLANLKADPKPRKVVAVDWTNLASFEVKEIKPKTNINVYVPDLGNWRSFRPESVTSFTNTIGEKLI